MTINYELGPLKKDGTHHVRILIVNGRGAENRKRISTNIDVPKKYVKGKVIKDLNILDKINSFIIECRKRYRGESIIERKVSTKELTDIVLGENTSLPDFFTFADKFISQSNVKGKKNYISAINSFKRFTAGHILKFKDITPLLLQQYENSIEGERAKSMYLGVIRHMWNKADEIYDEEMPKTPFKKYKVPKQKPKGQRAVDISVIHTIYNYKGGGERAMLARDCYILSFCLMGMNAADLFYCDTLEDGVIKYNRQKTKDRRADNAHMEVKINPFIGDLVEKYRDTNNLYVFNFYKRFTREADFVRSLNIGLKEILGEKSKVTFYSARHSWATIARNNVKASKADVNEGLVHVDRDMDVTDLYILRDYTIVNNLNKKVIDYTFKKKK